MNFLRSFRRALAEKKAAFRQDYFRSSDSQALKSSEFKNLVPFVSDWSDV